LSLIKETANHSYYCWHKGSLGKHDFLQLQTPHGHKPSPTGLTHPLTVANDTKVMLL
jgi:hypothetical protein